MRTRALSPAALLFVLALLPALPGCGGPDVDTRPAELAALQLESLDIDARSTQVGCNSGELCR